MDLEEVEKIVAHWASEIPEISCVFLFGSRVKGTCTGESDIDIAVEFDPRVIARTGDSDGLQTWFSRNQQWRRELQGKIPMRVQLEWHHPERTKIVSSGLAEGSRILYRKDQKETAQKGIPKVRK